ncbi:MAG: LPS export ABC transporter periplasmic protein LptC, partial [Hyphomicrobium sp.]
MATTTDLERHRGRTRATAFDIPVSDRTKNFARARRHTIVVRVLRWLLPLGGTAIVLVYALTMMETVGWMEGLPQLALPNIIPKNLTMHNPRYEGFNKDGGSYVVTADTAVQDFLDTTNITLKGIKGDLTAANKVKTNLTATRGVYDTKKGVLELMDGIDIASDNGMHALLSRAKIVTKTNVITTKEPVVVEMPAGSIRSNRMTINTKSHEMTFIDAVQSRLVPQNSSKTKAAAKAAPSADVPIIGAGNGPIDITADRLDINDTAKTAIFSGTVRAAQGDAALETAALQVSYEGGAAQGAGRTANDASSGTKLRRIQSTSPIVMTRAPKDRVTSQSLDYDAVKEVTVLTGNVVMTSGDDRRVTSDTAKIDQRANTILLMGNVVVNQGRNELKGGRLFVEPSKGHTQLTSPAGAGGRITARFYGGNAKPAGNQGTKAALKKAVVAGSNAATGIFKTDPNAPINIDADRLDVDDNAKVAKFRGDVRAKQGEFTVRTSELHSTYAGAAGLALKTGDSGKTGKEQPATLTRIEARGKVIVTSKGGQKATGDWAVFDVKKNTVTLGGDVVLTREKNVVRGTRLTIDMTTGKSVIQNDASAAWTATAAPGEKGSDPGVTVQGPLKGARPSAVFYPQFMKGKTKNGANSAVKPSNNASTAPKWAPKLRSP